MKVISEFLLSFGIALLSAFVGAYIIGIAINVIAGYTGVYDLTRGVLDMHAFNGHFAFIFVIVFICRVVCR